jgi:clan AA aspartic protease
MISGEVNSMLDAVLSLEVLPESGDGQSIDAVVDTGFSGYLTLSPQQIESLKLTWLYRQQGQLADGSLHTFDVFEATVLWDGEPRNIEVEAAAIEPLIGMALLERHELKIAVMKGGSVEITALNTARDQRREQ